MSTPRLPVPFVQKYVTSFLQFDLKKTELNCSVCIVTRALEERARRLAASQSATSGQSRASGRGRESDEKEDA